MFTTPGSFTAKLVHYDQNIEAVQRDIATQRGRIAHLLRVGVHDLTIQMVNLEIFLQRLDEMLQTRAYILAHYGYGGFAKDDPPRLHSVRGQMDNSQSYRGLDYSIRHEGGGRWSWHIHDRLVSGPFANKAFGELMGTRTDAMDTAKAAIDKEVDSH